VVGRSRNGATVVDEELQGWCVLAGGERVYEVPLPPDTCASLAEVAVTLTTEAGSTQASSPVDANRCNP
jgi:fimbrial chaperone protein